MARDDMLYATCPACGGTGMLNGPVSIVREGVETIRVSYPCPACEARRVVATGVMVGQLDRLVSQVLATKGE